MDRQWAMSHWNTPPVRNQAPLTALSSSLRCVSAAEHQTELQDKTPKASLKKRSIMEHSPGLTQVTKSLRRCSGNWTKMLLKGHLRIKCHSQYNKVIVTMLWTSLVKEVIFYNAKVLTLRLAGSNNVHSESHINYHSY